MSGLAHTQELASFSPSTEFHSKKGRVKPLFGWIWHIGGSLALAPGQSCDEAFGRLAPLFDQPGTSAERTSDTLTFQKKDPAAQDKMAVFDRGVLRVEDSAAGPVLHYHLASRILLLCFLAPLLFLAFAQVTVAISKLEAPSLEAAAKKAEKKDIVLPQNPIDKALGSPAPEKPRKDAAKKDDKRLKPTASYVFAGLFAVLYVVGRILEASLVKRLFKKALLGA
jgi:hypothetical protein